jgi:hypothetical protein
MYTDVEVLRLKPETVDIAALSSGSRNSMRDSRRSVLPAAVSVAGSIHRITLPNGPVKITATI